MNDTQRAAAFAHWWKTAGHWVDESPARALATWQGRGVHGLPDCTPGAAALVAGAQWLRDGEEWLRQLRAQNAAADALSGEPHRLERAAAWVRLENDPAALAAFHLELQGLACVDLEDSDPAACPLEDARAAILADLEDMAA